MRSFVRFAVPALALSVALTLVHVGSSQAQGDDGKPKNLKVLPKTMSHREVENVMRGWSMALGVRCSSCHVEAAPGEEPDFAADKKPAKERARDMLRMTLSINDQLQKMNFKETPQVTCVTCHHGVAQPRTLGALLMKTTHEKGADAAIADYRKLRDQYYGSGAYDFSPASLNDLAGQLSEARDFDSALKFLNLNLEFSPKDAGTYVAMGRVQMAKGDADAAKASFQKALDIDPQNRWAKRMLQQVQGGK